jgi:hypothetical protein
MIRHLFMLAILIRAAAGQSGTFQYRPIDRHVGDGMVFNTHRVARAGRPTREFRQEYDIPDRKPDLAFKILPKEVAHASRVSETSSQWQETVSDGPFARANGREGRRGRVRVERED